MTTQSINNTEEASLGRINSFSDGVFAVVITIMIFDLKKPADASFGALAQLWPTWISYVVSYLFIAIVWVNHHYLNKVAKHASPRLIWANFGHLFPVALIPFLTSWLADTRLAPVPMAMYALVFLLVNLSYLNHVYQALCTNDDVPLSDRTRHLLNVRSMITLPLFLAAVFLALWFPFLGFVIVCSCLLLYLRPDIPDKEVIGKQVKKHL